MAPLLKAENISRTLDVEVKVTLVREASLALEPGEFVAITGPSGSGKSSLLYLLGLLDRPTSGEIWFDGVATSELDEKELAHLRLARLGFVFQSHFLLPEFTALENVAIPMRRLGRLDEAEIKARAAQLLESFDLADKLDKLPRQLSGGQSQRVAIARALANDPTLILADEPTGNLDSVSSQNVQDILSGLAREKGRAVLTVTHEQAFAASADRVIHIVDGKIVSQG